ncbi:MAG: hypothetical protein WD295_04275, partial [Bacteroidota bacterium]
MVQFREDADPRTSGTGLFEVASGTPARIDPPPHDSAYFASKILFLDNYFGKVSNGKVRITGEIFQPVISLADSMAVYSPQTGEGNRKLARLVIDSWTAADTLNPGFPFSEFDAFMVFHAGVGRDINLVSLLGFDPTPHDIPSLFLNLDGLRVALDDPGFQGVPVNGGTLRITHSIILPETETRTFQFGSQSDTLHLGINGLVAASMGSFLGLPDLFDTNTGTTGIGQFGLMDGAGIFAYNGLFPPEPSAWEKVYLGWVEPILVTGTSTTVTVPAVGLTRAGQDTIYKIPINSKEYFLFENRHRDPGGDGQRVTLLRDGALVELHFGGDTTGFNFADIRGIYGSVIDVEDFDWATPGTTQQEGFEGSGMLIWHIDERELDARLAANSLNVDRDRRTVDLEEADGSQDIGHTFEFLQPGSGTEQGWPLDLWFAGNSSPVYKNVFTHNSFPNSRSADGLRTLITVRDFSPRSPRMTVTIERGSAGFTPLSSFTKSLRPGETPSITVSSSGIYFTSGGWVYAFDPGGLPKTPDPDGVLAQSGGQRKVAVHDFGDGRTLIAGVKDSTVWIWNAFGAGTGTFDSVNVASVNVGARVTTVPMIVDSALVVRVVVGDESGFVRWFTPEAGFAGTLHAGDEAVRALAQVPVTQSPGGRDVLASSGMTISGWTRSTQLPGPADRWRLVATATQQGTRIGAVSEGQSPPRMIVYGESDADIAFDTELEGGVVRVLGVLDITGDGKKNFIVGSGETLSVLNEAGIMSDGFPQRLTGQGTPVSLVIADVLGDGRPEIVILTDRGSLRVLNRMGNPIDELSLQVNDPGDGTLALFRTESGALGILTVSASGRVSGFETSVGFPSVIAWWGQEGGSSGNAMFDATVTQNPVPLASGFLPKSRVYNWPNPVYGSTTHVRYYVAEPADVVVTVFDLSGLKIT